MMRFKLFIVKTSMDPTNTDRSDFIFNNFITFERNNESCVATQSACINRLDSVSGFVQNFRDRYKMKWSSIVLCSKVTK